MRFCVIAFVKIKKVIMDPSVSPSVCLHVCFLQPHNLPKQIWSDDSVEPQGTSHC